MRIVNLSLNFTYIYIFALRLTILLLTLKIGEIDVRAFNICGDVMGLKMILVLQNQKI
tara:strand:- start:625 stop:798 length:174 start_codon:yes stop_codon:yes gene_type:complete